MLAAQFSARPVGAIDVSLGQDISVVLSGPNGSCLRAFVGGFSKNAGVRWTENPSAAFTGGSFWGPGLLSGYDLITSEILISCGFESPVIIEQIGAVGSRTSQERMGIQFEANEPNDQTRYKYTFMLVGASNTTLTNSRQPANSAPTSDAGPDQSNVASAGSVTLDGTGSSDPDAGDTLSYAWTQTDSTGETVTLSDAAVAQPTFTAPTLGANDAAITLTFSLVVTDDKANSSKADTVDITVTPPANSAPTSDAGPDQSNVASAGSVTLDGTGSSDPDAGDTLSYAWTQTDSTGETVTLSDAAVAQPTFTAPTLGANDAAITLTFSLVVTDDKANSSKADTVDITVTPPATIPSAPRSLVATPGDGTVSVAFTVPSRNGGAAITDYEYQIDDGNWRSASTISSPVIVTGLTNGTEYSIKLRAVNAVGKGEASQSVTFKMSSPSAAFNEYQEQITQIITDDAVRSLRSSIASNDRMIKNARERLIDSQRQRQIDEGGIASRNNVAFDVDGTAQVSGTTLSTTGTFFGQQGNFDGTSRRLVFGDFDVQHDGDTGSSTATMTGRVAWEWMASDTTMLGYFIGGELAHSNIAGAFDGDQDRLGVTVGGYAVHQLSEQLYADGYFSLGAGRNNLDMANDVLALTSHYTTQTATIGGALSGIYEYGQFELRPELAFSYGKTWIGDVGFTGRAYGLVDDTLSLDAGNVSIANLTLRPEVIWSLDGKTVADSNSQLSFAPRLTCESRKSVQRTEDCGGGAEFGLHSQSEDGLSRAEFRVFMDRVGDTTRSSLAFNLEHQF